MATWDDALHKWSLLYKAVKTVHLYQNPIMVELVQQAVQHQYNNNGY